MQFFYQIYIICILALLPWFISKQFERALCQCTVLRVLLSFIKWVTVSVWWRYSSKKVEVYFQTTFRRKYVSSTAEILVQFQKINGHHVASSLPVSIWPFQRFDTVGLVVWPVKIVPEMTYNVLSGTSILLLVILRRPNTFHPNGTISGGIMMS